MTLLDFVYSNVELYSYGRSNALGPPTLSPRSEVQTGCGAMLMTVTFKPYLGFRQSKQLDRLHSRNLPIFLRTNVLSRRHIKQENQIRDSSQNDLLAAEIFSYNGQILIHERNGNFREA